METSLKNVLLDAFWIMPATPKYKNQGLPYITSKNIKNRRIDFNDVKYIDEADYDVISRNRPILENDILISMIGTLGEVAVVKKEDGRFYGQNMYLIRLDESKVSQKYFLNWVESDAVKRAILQQQNKSTQSYLKAEHVEGLSIKLPSVDEQNRIADIFERINQLTENRKQQLQKLDELVKARFVELFGDLGSPHCKWDLKKLVDVCVNADDIKCGPFGTQLCKDEYKDDGVAVWEIPQINSIFSTAPTHYITEDKAKQLEAYSIKPGDIAMSRKGNVGKCAVFPSCLDKGIIHSDVLRIRVNDGMVLPLFMMHQLHYSGAVQNQIELVSSGAIMAGINVTKLKQIFVHIPPLELQKEFVDFLKQIDKSKLSVQKSLEKLETLNKALMQKYFG